MARRNDIDWEKAERLYSAGQLTIKEVAAECGVSDSQLRAKAKKEGWRRDLSDEIRRQAKAKVSALDVSALVEQSAQESAHKSAALIREAIEQASDVAAGVMMRHRASVRLDHERAGMLEALFDHHLQGAESIVDVARAAQAYKAMIDSKTKLRDEERSMYGLDEQKGGDEIENVVVEYVDAPARD